MLARECAELNQAFNKWVQTKRPWVIAKCGMTLDGRLSRRGGEERWITSRDSRAHANRFRARVDAILIGAETLRTDNPRLTARGVRGARQPWRVVFSRTGQLPREAHLFTDRFAERTLVFRGQSLVAVLDDLGQREIISVLIEGGGEVLGEALDGRLIDEVQIYMSPLFTGGPTVAFAGSGAASTESGIRLRDIRYDRIGEDIFLQAKTASAVASVE